ncbi:hypothetical protein BC940DRAFT_367841 [Gongronella butleri]|nr:hypothetical protein BC940DRAFT_367841 [Gongronella butleri]
MKKLHVVATFVGGGAWAMSSIWKITIFHRLSKNEISHAFIPTNAGTLKSPGSDALLSPGSSKAMGSSSDSATASASYIDLPWTEFSKLLQHKKPDIGKKAVPQDLNVGSYEKAHLGNWGQHL